MRLYVLIGLATMLQSWCLAASSAEAIKCNSETPTASVQTLADTPLPERIGPRIQTSGTVPHVQKGVVPVAEINKALLRLAFTLPGLERRPTIVSLPGAIGMWLADDVQVAQPKAIVSGREFAHIHSDGSLHAPLPLDRALELENKGWGERHPWAERRDGWEGLVMLYSASTLEELNTLIQLIAESYSYVTGQRIQVAFC